MKKSVCTIILVAANVIVFFALSFIGMTEDAGFMVEHGAVYIPYIIERGEYYRIFTAMFLHFGFEHLMNNMLMLAVIGWHLEQETGRLKFLIIYFGSGAGGMLLSIWRHIHTGDYAVSAGASGAIFGLIGALLYIAFRNHGRIGELTGRGLLFMAALSLYYGFSSGGVDNMAHIGGLLSGVLIAVLVYRKRESEPGEDARL